MRCSSNKVPDNFWLRHVAGDGRGGRLLKDVEVSSRENAVIESAGTELRMIDRNSAYAVGGTADVSMTVVGVATNDLT